MNGLRECLEQGAQARAKDRDGWWALHCAVFYGELEMLGVLIDKSASLTDLSSRGWTPLMQISDTRGAESRMKAEECARVLLERGADVDAQSFRGETALLLCVEAGMSGLATFLGGAGADLDKADNKGMTPLMVAAITGRDDLVEELLLGGADPSIRAPDGKTAEDFFMGGRGKEMLVAAREALTLKEDSKEGAPVRPKRI